MEGKSDEPEGAGSQKTEEKVDEPAPNAEGRLEQQNESVPVRERPLVRCISVDFKTALGDTNRPATRSVQTKTLLRYARYLILGLKLSSHSKDIGESEAQAGATTFPLAFETRKRDAVRIIDVSRKTKLYQARDKVAKPVSYTHLTLPTKA